MRLSHVSYSWPWDLVWKIWPKSASELYNDGQRWPDNVQQKRKSWKSPERKEAGFTGKICTRNKLAWQINLWRVAQWLHVDRVFPSYWHLQDRIETSQDGQGSAHERFKIFAPSHFGKAQACGSWKRRWTNTVRHHPRGGKGKGLVAWPRQSRRHNSSTGWVLTAGEKVWHLAKGQVQADWWHERKSPEWLLYDLW